MSAAAQCAGQWHCQVVSASLQWCLQLMFLLLVVNKAVCFWRQSTRHIESVPPRECSEPVDAAAVIHNVAYIVVKIKPVRKAKTLSS